MRADIILQAAGLNPGWFHLRYPFFLDERGVRMAS